MSVSATRVALPSEGAGFLSAPLSATPGAVGLPWPPEGMAVLPGTPISQGSLEVTGTVSAHVLLVVSYSFNDGSLPYLKSLPLSLEFLLSSH